MRFPLTVAAALLIVRLPSLVQPMGADQALYAYVGERILAGGIPYRDAWDQKPPAIHYTYAALRAIWPADAVVAAADLALAAAVAWLLFLLGRLVAPGATGALAATVFLLLSNPAFTRVGGVRLRAQCETFIAIAVAGSFVLLVKSLSRATSLSLLGAGALLSLACCYKYNAAVYSIAGVLILWLWGRFSAPHLAWLGIGFCVPVAALVLGFAAGGALMPMYDATVRYNIQYSGETYRGLMDAVRYLLTFPIERARVDAQWTLGGAGCAVLLLAAIGHRERLAAVVWVAAACLAIAINGSRGLPQYFVQANPALAFAAAWAATITWEWLHQAFGRTGRILAAAIVALVAVAVWRVNQFPKLIEQTAFDARYATGTITRTDHLARYADDRKYSALQADALADFLRGYTSPDDLIYVFGFTCSAYVNAGRFSASRFFWSRPVIVGFMSSVPGYGVAGLHADLERNNPVVVALQRKDWAPDASDSAEFFMATPLLAAWLRSHYVPRDGPDGFDVWMRSDRR